MPPIWLMTKFRQQEKSTFPCSYLMYHWVIVNHCLDMRTQSGQQIPPGRPPKQQEWKGRGETRGTNGAEVPGFYCFNRLDMTPNWLFEHGKHAAEAWMLVTKFTTYVRHVGSDNHAGSYDTHYDTHRYPFYVLSIIDGERQRDLPLPLLLPCSSRSRVCVSYMRNSWPWTQVWSADSAHIVCLSLPFAQIPHYFGPSRWAQDNLTAPLYHSSSTFLSSVTTVQLRHAKAISQKS